MVTLGREEAHRRVCAVYDLCRAEGTPRGERDATLLSLLFGARLAADRVVRLPLRAYDPGQGRLQAPDGPPLRARSGARQALDAWLAHRGRAPGPLLCRLESEASSGPLGAGGNAPSDERPLPLEVDDVERILADRAGAVGLDLLALREARRLYRSPWWERTRNPPASGCEERGAEP